MRKNTEKKMLVLLKKRKYCHEYIFLFISLCSLSTSRIGWKSLHSCRCVYWPLMDKSFTHLLLRVYVSGKLNAKAKHYVSVCVREFFFS